MKSSMHVLLASLLVAASACSSGGAGGAPTPNSNIWIAQPWVDTTGSPAATAYRGQSNWVYARLSSLSVDTTADSVARAMFQFSLDCNGCLFYFRTSQAIDSRGEHWDVADMPAAPHPGPDGFGWVVAQGSQQLYVVYSIPTAGLKHRPSALSLIIPVATGFRGLTRDPFYHPGRVDPSWFQDLKFDPVTLDWSKATVKK